MFAYLLSNSQTIESDSTSYQNWTLNISSTIVNIASANASFGVRPDATEDYDSQYDVPSPPSPPGDYIEMYFPHSGGNWPAFLGNKYKTDFTDPLKLKWLFKIETTLSSGIVSIIWDTSTVFLLPTGYSIILKDSTTGNKINMRKENNYQFDYNTIRYFLINIEFDSVEFTVKPGWNLISVPRSGCDSLKGIIFPNAISNAFSYNNNYIIRDTLRTGIGYWLKFSAQETITITGLPDIGNMINVKKGWNIIGSIDREVSIPVNSLIISNFFEYDNGYKVSTTLKPGKGYWVKINNDGDINIGNIKLIKK
jgi:hypothetical protein